MHLILDKYNTNPLISTRYSVDIPSISLLPSDNLKAFKPVWWRTLRYKPTTSAVTKMLLSGTLPIVFIFSKIAYSLLGKTYNSTYLVWTDSQKIQRPTQNSK